MSSSTSAAPKVGFVSLGCPKALVDSEQILTQLRAEGYETAKSYDGADLVIVNTCGFIDAAVQESLDAIGEALHENGKVIVTGCLGKKKDAAGDDLIQKIHPKVLAVTGPHALAEVMDAVHVHLPKPHEPFIDLVPAQGIKLTPRHYAYLKISEGCNHRCSFCIIPSMRGDLVSRAIADVMLEAENLFKAGVKELLVISQDTSAYGVDVKFRTGFWNGKPVRTHMTDLVKAWGELAAQYGAWVRLHYVYPYPHVDDIIPLMSPNGLLPYIDIPLQHASPTILKAMKRPANQENTLKRIEKWREICPDLTIRSTFIVGFPGETDTDFEMLLDFIKEARLDRVGCFQYSPVEGAEANQLPHQVTEDVKQERFDRFMQLQAQISAEKLEAKQGSIVQVLVDDINDEHVIARSSADAPEIDGLVYLPFKKDIKIGEFYSVKIVDSDEYDLYGKWVK